jgi:hypothetical protein
MKMLTGDDAPQGGDAWINNRSVRNSLSEVYKVMGYCPQFDQARLFHLVQWAAHATHAHSHAHTHAQHRHAEGGYAVLTHAGNTQKLARTSGAAPPPSLRTHATHNTHAARNTRTTGHVQRTARISRGRSARTRYALCLAQVWPELTGREHLEIFAAIKGVPAGRVDEMVSKALESMTLKPCADQPVPFTARVRGRRSPHGPNRAEPGFAIAFFTQVRRQAHQVVLWRQPSQALGRPRAARTRTPPRLALAA